MPSSAGKKSYKIEMTTAQGNEIHEKLQAEASPPQVPVQPAKPAVPASEMPDSLKTPNISVPQQRNKNSKLPLIILGVGLIAAIGMGGWFSYDYLRNIFSSNPAATDSNILSLHDALPI